MALVLGLQGGYTKYPCFLCMWDSRADEQHYIKCDWPERQALQPGSYNLLSQPLVNPSTTSPHQAWHYVAFYQST